jgi:periplasmic divalent cation tolerance protein
MPLVIVTTTLPTEEAADLLATQLVEDGVAACAQVIGPIESTYRWEGALERSEEYYCHCKAPEERRDALMARIKELHPYEVPEIVAVRADAVDPTYLAWARKSTGPGPETPHTESPPP